MTHTFGDTYEEHSFVGVRRIPAITFAGKFDDDTTTGTAGMFGQSSDLGAERVLRLNFAGTTGTTGAGTNVKMDTMVQSYKRTPGRSMLTTFELVVQPTGTWSAVSTT